MIILYVLLGVFIGAVAAYVLMDKRLDAVAAESGKKDIALAGCREQLNGATSRAQHLEASAVELNAKIQEKEEENKEIAERAGLFKAQVATLQRELELVKQQRDDEKVRHEKEVREQKEAHEKELSNQKEAMRQYKDEMSQRDEQFKNMARTVLEENTKKLEEENKKTMEGVTTPLKDAVSEKLGALNELLSKMSDASVERVASLSEMIKQMMEKTQIIGEQADNITRVIKGGNNKAIGNMGEIVLGNLLEHLGFSEGIHYEVQPRLCDEQGRPLKHEETGKGLQPDVILHYPQGKDAIVDSKVSLVAYEKYNNAETEEEKKQYLKEHISSVRQHVKELAKKDYSSYLKNGRKAVDFVIMFVPFESSLQLALAHDSTLWREAFDQNVFITGEQNLTAILHMIHIAWVQDQQAKKQKEVFRIADDIVKYVQMFKGHYESLGAVLANAQKTYDEGKKNLYVGRQSIVQKATKLVKYGAKESSLHSTLKLPEELDVEESIVETEEES